MPPHAFADEACNYSMPNRDKATERLGKDLLEGTFFYKILVFILLYQIFFILLHRKDNRCRHRRDTVGAVRGNRGPRSRRCPD